MFVVEWISRRGKLLRRVYADPEEAALLFTFLTGRGVWAFTWEL